MDELLRAQWQAQAILILDRISYVERWGHYESSDAYSHKCCEILVE